MQATKGFVLGKFLPPHLGHVYLFDFARNYVDELAIVVETEPDQPIPGTLRYQWVKEMFPDASVLHLTDGNPQEPSEHPQFWDIWKQSLHRILPFQPDFVFASEEYGWKLADVMGAQFVHVDIDRHVMPVSGTMVRESPLKHWEFLPRISRPYFAKRVCVFGPESTGKSTLAQNLARHFDTVHVPEYARSHIEARNGELKYEDIPMIARGQLASEQAIAFNTNRVMFCDTDLLTTMIWSNWMFDRCPDWIVDQANHRDYDLYLVTDVDVPWVDDTVRYLPEERKSFLDRCIAELEQRGRRYVLVSGDWEQRWNVALAAVQALLEETNSTER